jgi:hypothetical protein
VYTIVVGAGNGNGGAGGNPGTVVVATKKAVP